jgi:gas vesicle protein
MAEHIDTADHIETSGQGTARAKFDEAAASTKSLSEQAISVGKDLSSKAKNLAEGSTEALKDHASDFVDAAKDVASQATDKIKDAVNDRKSSGAEYVGNLADTMRRAAREFDTDLPLAGTYIRKAASQVEGVSDTIRKGNFNDLVRNAQLFARRQPTAFLSLAVLAGFGVVRFLKSSSEESSTQSGGSGTRSTTAARTNNEGYRDDFSN